MNYIKNILFLNFISIIIAITNNNNNYGIRIRNMGLRLIVLKEKKIHKILNNIHNNINKYHDNIIVYVANSIYRYNELSEDDRLLIETVISLCC